MSALPTQQSLSQLLDPATFAGIVGAHAATTRDPSAFVRLDRHLFPNNDGRETGDEANTSGSEIPTFSDRGDSDSMSKATLLDILTWKLLRGKHRPFLPKLVASNSDAAVQSAYAAAIQLLSPAAGSNAAPQPFQVLAALTALSAPLKGVGPATASAVLATVSPHVPFMSDEILLRSGVASPFKYSVKEYERVLTWVDDTIRDFAHEDMAVSTWTRRSLERALWAHSVQARTGANSLSVAAATAGHTTTSARKPKRTASTARDQDTKFAHDAHGDGTLAASSSKRARRGSSAAGISAQEADLGKSSEAGVRRSSRLVRRDKQEYIVQ